MAKSPKELPSTILKQMTTLAGSAFSLVAALAWNDLIKSFIEEYIKPYTAKGSGIVAQLVYAVAITVLVVLITYQLAWLQEHLEKKTS
jgi:hypothetical protein